MRSFGVRALLLTLIAILMVMVAAIVFLSQGRRTLLTRQERIQGENEALNQLVAESERAISARESDLATAVASQATAEAAGSTRQEMLEASQRELNDVITERDMFQSELTELEVERQQRAPLVTIIAPNDQTTITSESEIQLVVSAADPVGLTALFIEVGDELVADYELEDPLTFAGQATWSPSGTGVYTISARATNSNGQASDPVTVTVTVEEAEPEGGGRNQALVDDPNAAIRADIESDVVAIRGLVPLQPVVPTLLDQTELRQRLEDDIVDYSKEDAADDARALSAFDFLSFDFDLHTFTLDLYGEQIGGFYDPETDEFVVISADDELGAYEKTVHAHEFVHALQDQYYDLALLEDDNLDSEASLALRALAEGEATLVQLLYIFSDALSEDDLDEIFTESAETESPVLDSAPPVLAHNLEFPYTAGLQFVEFIFDQEGGFDGVEAVWSDPPVSTEQILHPERYLADDDPQIVSTHPLTDTLGSGWRQVEEDTLGEFFLREYLSQQLNDNAVDVAATGWDGDRYAVFWREADDAFVLVLNLVWDSTSDAAEFHNAYRDYPAALYGTSAEEVADGATCWSGEDTICMFPGSVETIIVRAPDTATAIKVAALQTP